MKKTIFLSLVAGAMIFAGCGGGGGGGSSSSSGGASSSSGGSTSSSGGASSSSGGSTSSGGAAKTYTKYGYSGEALNTANMIKVNDDGKTWTIETNDGRQAGAVGYDKTYAAAKQFCAEHNQSLPSPKDLLTTALQPTDGTSASWADGKYVVFYTDKVIGQSSDQEANEQRKVICMQGTSIEQKHATEDIALTVDDNGTQKDLTGIRDIVTGLRWTPIYTYDKDTINTGHSNQSRFPISDANGTDIDAATYCSKFGQGWRLPTLAELRTITYLDGTTGLKDPENLKPAIFWTSTQSGTTGKHYAIHLNPNNNPNQPYYNEAPEADRDKYFVTCVNDQ